MLVFVAAEVKDNIKKVLDSCIKKDEATFDLIPLEAQGAIDEACTCKDRLCNSASTNFINSFSFMTWFIVYFLMWNHKMGISLILITKYKFMFKIDAVEAVVVEVVVRSAIEVVAVEVVAVWIVVVGVAVEAVVFAILSSPHIDVMANKSKSKIRLQLSDLISNKRSPQSVCEYLLSYLLKIG